MNILKKSLTATALAALVVAGVGLAPQAALADQIAGTVTITPTSGTVDDSPFLNSIAVSTGCPTGYQAMSGTVVVQGGTVQSVATTRLPSTSNPGNAYGYFGLDGSAISMDRVISPTNNYVSNKTLSALATPLTAGSFELRVYCFASSTAVNYTTDKYFSLPMTLDASGNWAVASAVVAESTTVGLTGVKNGDNTVTLTATVKKADGTTATAAPGSVEFQKADGTVLGTGTVTNGVATYTTSVLTDGAYEFKAKYTSSNTSTWASSALSGGFSVTVGDSIKSTSIGVTIPAGVGALVYTGVPASVSLGTASLSNGKLVASGSLSGITVSDTRQLGSSSWSLTGQVGDFADGAKTLDGKYLGWTPALSGTGNAGTAGAAVVAGSGSGLKAASVLASGSVVDGSPTTAVGASLSLAAPSNTPAGSYTATLTLTLI